MKIFLTLDVEKYNQIFDKPSQQLECKWLVITLEHAQ